jgi:hypothetical protein
MAGGEFTKEIGAESRSRICKDGAATDLQEFWQKIVRFFNGLRVAIPNPWLHPQRYSLRSLGFTK